MCEGQNYWVNPRVTGDLMSEEPHSKIGLALMSGGPHGNIGLTEN